MTLSRRQKFEKFQRDVLDQLTKTNTLLEKVAALLVSEQLLQECVSPEGTARSAADCAEIITESYCAGLCLAEELSSHNRDFDYQKSEFFLDSDEEDGDSDESDEDDEDDDNTDRRPFQMSF
jgi:hypothetical protein